jgi:hypothetical protein
MTREEEIQKLIDEEIGIDNYGSSDYQVGVSDGVRLADKTMIEKACKWLKLNTNWDDEWDEMGRNMDYGKIEEFRKAMEEQV